MELATFILPILRYRLGMFADSFQCDLLALSPDDMQSFFERIQLGPCSFNNFLRTLTTFCRFAQDRGWLSREVDLLGVKRRKETRTPVEIFSPQEMAALLEHATPKSLRVLPWAPLPDCEVRRSCDSSGET